MAVTVAPTRDRIVAAASAVLGAQEGNNRFPLEAIAKAASVTRRTLYDQFGSRRALLQAVFDDRAARAGLGRLPEAMADRDPHAGLQCLITIFCDFWNFDRSAIARVHAAGADGAALRESLRTRHVQRRHALSVLVGRMVDRGEVQPAALNDLVDTLFVLTSFYVFTELTADGRPADVASGIVQKLATDAVDHAGTAHARPGEVTRTAACRFGREKRRAIEAPRCRTIDTSTGCCS